MWKTLEIFTPFRNCPGIIMERKRKQATLVEQALLVLWILLLRPTILFERLLRLLQKSVAVAQIGSHVGVVQPARDGFLVLQPSLASIPLIIKGVAL